MPPPASQRRALVRDACRCLSQQMIFWGADARHREGNLLVAFGLERQARAEGGGEGGGEGSSQYLGEWSGGVIGLHSFCAGWRPARGPGVLFIRHRERLHASPPGAVLTPGDDRGVVGAAPDVLLPAAQPLFAWMVAYERWVAATQPPGYRAHCWRCLLSRLGARPWLAPEPALAWMTAFAADPTTTPRARQKSQLPVAPPKTFRSSDPTLKTDFPPPRDGSPTANDFSLASPANPCTIPRSLWQKHHGLSATSASARPSRNTRRSARH